MAQGLAGTKVLVVDNSQTVRVRMQMILEEYRVECILASDGDEGLERFRESPDIGLIFCDLNMPRMDGLTMIEKIQETGKPLPPTVLVTTESSMKMVERAKALGVRGWIVKPVTKDVIGELLNQIHLGE